MFTEKKFKTWKLGLIEKKRSMARRYLETGGGRPKNNSTEENYIAHESSNIHEVDTHWTSWLVPMWWLLILLFFVISMDLNNCVKNNFGPQCGCVAKFLGRFSFEPMQENWFSFEAMQENSLLSLTEMGALGWESAGNGHQGWRLDTCMGLYAGIMHLLASMLSLFFIGIRLEQPFGYGRIGVIYW
ncbi:RHOMBOID-like protein 2 isoform X1 [Vigna radiata var. radiata]|uniref:RHOMBOID-like protein n=1 Tax=Vigna radiata var. radiata TaxID=3916 RepID=A0A3Q0FED2_VIGRR|nr:RHOMBOID-like protein 2 isoform X1 [Vigna radiata var. radiata]